MKIKNSKMPLVVIAVGLVLMLLVCMLVSLKKAPTVKEAEFELTVHYTLDGEEKTYVSKYKCTFDGHGNSLDPLGRYYIGEYADYNADIYCGSYTVAEKDGYQLAILTFFNNPYIMGDTENEYYDSELQDPYFVVYTPDGGGGAFTDQELLDMFDAEIISCEHPEPIENSFVISGLAVISETSMLVMILFGILTTVACVLLVKKEEGIKYKVLDAVGIILNLVIALVALPFVTLIVWLLQAFSGDTSILPQFHLCVPAVTIFAIAASISLRRLGRSKLGFFVQFAGPAMFLILMAIEVVITYSR